MAVVPRWAHAHYGAKFRDEQGKHLVWFVHKYALLEKGTSAKFEYYEVIPLTEKELPVRTITIVRCRKDRAPTFNEYDSPHIKTMGYLTIKLERLRDHLTQTYGLVRKTGFVLDIKVIEEEAERVFRVEFDEVDHGRLPVDYI